MSQKKIIFCFMAMGLLLPIAWFIFYWTVGQDPYVSGWLMQTRWWDRVLLMLWPSSILLICCTDSVMLPILSVILNVVIYAVLGWFFWIGCKRSRIVLVATIISILASWYGLLRL